MFSQKYGRVLSLISAMIVFTITAVSQGGGGSDRSLSLTAVRAKPATRAKPQTFWLEGSWQCNDEGTYEVTQSGAIIKWDATSKDGGKTFSHHFEGTIEGDIIKGHYKDNPSGSVHQEGDLKFRILSNKHLSLLEHSVPFNCTEMTRWNDQP